ncbi:uncharacterized protein UDID_18923 [Ustilago sp. UG-2017a]|nr:uncharacterized protein UDID_18923 [Ustilago sp. UG-2017a]
MVEQEARGLAGTGSRHGWRATSMESAVSMETMDMEDRPICKEVQALRRDQAQGACRWLPLRGSRDKSQRNHHRSKEEEQCIGDRQAGPEEEEQCRLLRHCSGGTGVLSRTGPTVGNDDEGEIERRGRGDYQTSEGVDERVD